METAVEELIISVGNASDDSSDDDSAIWEEARESEDSVAGIESDEFVSDVESEQEMSGVQPLSP